MFNFYVFFIYLNSTTVHLNLYLYQTIHLFNYLYIYLTNSRSGLTDPHDLATLSKGKNRLSAIELPTGIFGTDSPPLTSQQVI